ncbi:beta-glucosidase family protein [Blastococcus aurantiacus]|uniref:beta-glucosidase family protein n=1 Tax=Blastococcus aurantiacus TaxID=1550231 RepID=UPI000A8DF9E8|nr:glycoside hydrolase family 3 C-terminal domain-containing protein [Blastococcus aurantiacus]
MSADLHPRSGSPEPGAADVTTELAERAALTSGSSTWHTTAAVGVPLLVLADGPHGVRRQRGGGDALGIGTSVPATCFPPAVGLGATWDVDLLRRVGAALGAEARALDVDVLLAPGMNIKRSPLNGRNFEYLSEDPFLTGRLAAAMVEGIQSAGVAACIKHFAVNNQETDRMRVSADVDDRALREVYLAAFEHVVRTARPWMVMSAYNRVNGVPASEHPWLLTEVLRDEWGYDGVVVSDWGAVEDRVAAVRAGLDLEMPPSGTDERIVAAVTAGELDEAVLDRVADRMARLAERVRATAPARPEGWVEGSASDDDLADMRAAHHALAREAATASVVLLKNDGRLLPLDRAAGQSVAVVGELARTPRFQGGGSSRVVPTRLSSALDALSGRLGDRLRFAAGYTLDGTPSRELVDEAVATARDADVAVVFLGLPEAAESEGFDRTTIDLPDDQLALLSAVAEVAPEVVVVLSNGGVVSVSPWQDRAGAVLEGWLLGQAGGEAVADLLLGDAAPSGRLAEAIPLRLADHPSHLHFPGRDGTVTYGEGTYVGYRQLDTLDVPVAYPFGHGLTYTTFAYSDPRVTACGENAWEISWTVTNTGPRAGREVAQLYVGRQEDRPTRPRVQLAGFASVALEPGASQRVALPLRARDLSTWDAAHRRWSLAAGTYDVRMGASSRDVRLVATVETGGDRFLPPLTRMSTIGEWRADPAGSEVLSALLGRFAAAAGRGTVAPELLRMLDDFPLVKLRTFRLGLTEEVIDGLVEQVAAEHRRLVDSGRYRSS